MGKIADATRTWAIGIEQKRQLLAFDAEFDEMETKVRILEGQKLKLESQVKPLEAEVEGLKKQLKEQTTKAERAEKLAAFKAEKEDKPKSVVHDELDGVEQTFLSYLASMKQKENRTTEKVADAVRRVHPQTQMTELKAEVYLDRLDKRGFVSPILNMEGRNYWGLTMRGKEYVVLHNLEYGKGDPRPEAPQRLDKTSEEMLLRIANRQRPIRENVIAEMSLSVAKGNHHYDVLRERNFVQTLGSAAGGVLCSATAAGRKYLADNDLI